MSIIALPLGDHLSAQDTLAAASHRPFEDVLILGAYEDGLLRHASTMSVAHQLHILELYKLILLGMVENASLK